MFYAVHQETGALLGPVPECPTVSAAALSNGPGPACDPIGPEDSYLITVTPTRGGGYLVTLPGWGAGGVTAPLVSVGPAPGHYDPLRLEDAAAVGAAAIHALLRLDRGYGT
jgi:hypothetical protein